MVTVTTDSWWTLGDVVSHKIVGSTTYNAKYFLTRIIFLINAISGKKKDIITCV